jgi:hypothetical protein
MGVSLRCETLYNRAGPQQAAADDGGALDEISTANAGLLFLVVE